MQSRPYTGSSDTCVEEGMVYCIFLLYCLISILDLSLVSMPLERSISLYSPMVTTPLEELPSLPVVTAQLQQLPVEHNIILEPLPFYNIISEILQPSYLGEFCWIFDNLAATILSVEDICFEVFQERNVWYAKEPPCDDVFGSRCHELPCNEVVL